MTRNFNNILKKKNIENINSNEYGEEIKAE